jgi:glucose-1-phosphate cytidylyltransferase
MQTVILCGGQGTRLGEHSRSLPKPLMEVGGMPILWHTMKIYAHYGHTDFILCLGYMGKRIKDYFTAMMRENGESSWSIVYAHTGPYTNTGGRVKLIEDLVEDETFFVTYGDGLARIDLDDLLRFHKSHNQIATVTAVRPQVNFGLMEIDPEGLVRNFREKPVLDYWANGGFFVFDRPVFDYLSDDCILEREPFERMALESQLAAYRHRGFWMCMDTCKDNLKLNEIWDAGDAPWKIWSEQCHSDLAPIIKSS